jgi:hypothetical protein
MTKSRLFSFALLPLMLAAPAASPAQCVAPGLQDNWRGNDGGTYAIRVSGNEVRWRARSGDNGRSWANEFRGYRGPGKTFTGDWWDVKKPWGKGRMTVKMLNDWTLVRTASTGSFFGGTRWTRPRPPRGCNDTAGGPVDE